MSVIPSTRLSRIPPLLSVRLSACLPGCLSKETEKPIYNVLPSVDIYLSGDELMTKEIWGWGREGRGYLWSETFLGERNNRKGGTKLVSTKKEKKKTICLPFHDPAHT